MKLITDGHPLMDAGQDQATMALLAVRTMEQTLESDEPPTDTESHFAISLLTMLSNAGLGLARGLARESTVGVAMLEASQYQLQNPDLPIGGVGVMMMEPGDECPICDGSTLNHVHEMGE